METNFKIKYIIVKYELIKYYVSDENGDYFYKKKTKLKANIMFKCTNQRVKYINTL